MDVYMGVDVGSVSVKIVMIDENNNVVEKVWLRNQGSPIESVRKGIDKLKSTLESNKMMDKINIVGVGTTGSARYLIKSVLGADIAKTEIIAHAVASSTLYPGVQTILEIGGQDSKIIILRNGIVTDFAMNTVCAAGTGSFLDHQSQRLGIPIEQFGDYALKSTVPVTIAGRCSVFAESDMVHKAQMGYTKEDIIAGLCHALVRNYMNNVGKGKEIKGPVVFQGGVAFNKGIIKAFENELNIQVTVPPNGMNILMGALGAALLVKEEVGRVKAIKGTFKTAFRGFELLDLKFTPYTFNCKDCPNRCEVVSIVMSDVEIDKTNFDARTDSRIIARWGDRCGKWEIY